ncbi:PREDICTED: uncharacterized protein LOC109214361 [Nicotiana attenuata]|uniref:uncharacterized protein LOC109214361 n=1 Tax=Nicotiana attenuata TaxID=49451 RepID=UPI0009055973|nr:PREDICTED: uncharacterized protein LOC109214361 [Nicotiana attenuata]
MTSPKIQKDIVSACAQEIVKAIIDDLDGDYFGILVDESKDISHHEQMALAFRYVDKKGQVNEPFISLVRVSDTSAKSLKEAVLSLLMKHSLNPSKIRGQGYDGNSNMQGKMNGLKALILQETPSAFSVHCFAYRLQLTLVGIAKKHKEVETFFAIVTNVLNVIGVSFKRRDQLRGHQAELLQQLLESGEVQSGKRLSQERGLQRLALIMSNELSKALQKKDQDIVNAMVFLDITKERLQEMRDKGWEPLMDESKRRPSSVTYSHHLRVELFYAVIDLQFLELNSHFDVVSSNLLLGMASLNLANSFANFDKERIITLDKHYPDEFGELKLRDLSRQLDTFLWHMQHGDPRFSSLKGIGDLAKVLVEENLVETYSLIYLLVKLTLTLPVATATVERAFSSMKYIKCELSSSISDAFLNDCLVCYFEKEVFVNISNDAIIDRFQNMNARRVQL